MSSSKKLLKQLSKALFIGTLLSCLLMAPFLYGSFENPNTYEPDFDLKRLIVSVVLSPLLVVFAFPIWAPTIMILLIVGHVFYKNIYKYKVVWCLSVPIVFWFLMAILFGAGLPEFSSSWFKSFVSNLFNSISLMVFLLPSALCSLIFYKISGDKS